MLLKAVAIQLLISATTFKLSLPASGLMDDGGSNVLSVICIVNVKTKLFSHHSTTKWKYEKTMVMAVMEVNLLTNVDCRMKMTTLRIR